MLRKVQWVEYNKLSSKNNTDVHDYYCEFWQLQMKRKK